MKPAGIPTMNLGLVPRTTDVVMQDESVGKPTMSKGIPGLKFGGFGGSGDNNE